MSSDSKNVTLGGGIIAVTIVFVVLKLINVSPIAQLDWLWVFSPLWISIAWTLAWFLIGLLFNGALLAGVGIFALGKRGNRRERVRYTNPIQARANAYHGLPNNDKNFVNLTAPRRPQR